MAGLRWSHYRCQSTVRSRGLDMTTFTDEVGKRTGPVLLTRGGCSKGHGRASTALTLGLESWVIETRTSTFWSVARDGRVS